MDIVLGFVVDQMSRFVLFWICFSDHHGWLWVVGACTWRAVGLQQPQLLEQTTRLPVDEPGVAMVWIGRMCQLGRCCIGSLRQ